MRLGFEAVPGFLGSRLGLGLVGGGQEQPTWPKEFKVIHAPPPTPSTSEERSLRPRPAEAWRADQSPSG